MGEPRLVRYVFLKKGKKKRSAARRLANEMGLDVQTISFESGSTIYDAALAVDASAFQGRSLRAEGWKTASSINYRRPGGYQGGLPGLGKRR